MDGSSYCRILSNGLVYFEVVVVDVIYFDLSVHGRSTLVARILLRKKNDPLPNVAQMCPTRFISAGIGLQGM